MGEGGLDGRGSEVVGFECSTKIFLASYPMHTRYLYSSSFLSS